MASVTIEIDGVIDLGPKWNFAYNVQPKVIMPQPLNSSLNNVHIKREREVVTPINRDFTRMDEGPPVPDVFGKPHTVKEDKQINEFAFHVYKQSLKVFDVIKKKVDPKIWHKVDFIARSYDDKFRAFVDDTLNYNIKTKLGTQKVVLNTIDTSNRLMRRLVNYLLGEMSREGILRNQMNVANVLQSEVEKESMLEYRHICTKFGICRTARGFNSFMVDVFTILLKGDDTKLKIASDALTEVLKDTNFSQIMTKSTQSNFRKRIADAETWDATMTRAIFIIIKNLFALKNQPLKVMTKGTEYIQSTVVALEIIDEFDKALPSNEENVLAWSDITTSLNQWQQNKRDDLLEIFQSLISHILDNGINSMTKETLEKIKQKLSFIFS